MLLALELAAVVGGEQVAEFLNQLVFVLGGAVAFVLLEVFPLLTESLITRIELVLLVKGHPGSLQRGLALGLTGCAVQTTTLGRGLACRRIQEGVRIVRFEDRAERSLGTNPAAWRSGKIVCVRVQDDRVQTGSGGRGGQGSFRRVDPLVSVLQGITGIIPFVCHRSFDFVHYAAHGTALPVGAHFYGGGKLCCSVTPLRAC